MMELYRDDFMVLVENKDKGCVLYADALLGFFEMSVAAGKYIVKKLNENEKHGYFLLSCAKKIRKRG